MRASSPTAWALLATLALAPGCESGRDEPATGTARAQDNASERQTARERMVRTQIQARGVADPRVLAAMRKVPRDRFVPGDVRALAYRDSALPIGYAQTISQPYVVAFMTEALQPKPTDKVLEIGTGSGYQAAVLGEIVSQVFTIEIVEPLARRAAKTLEDAGYDNVHVRAGDGYRGWPEESPFDAIIVTAAPDHVPQPLVDQLRVGGRMILPVGDRLQELVLLEKTADGVTRRSVLPVRFVPMTGEAQHKR